MGTFVFVLVAVSTVAPFHHAAATRLISEHVAVFASADSCDAERRAMDYTIHTSTYFCQKELLK